MCESGLAPGRSLSDLYFFETSTGDFDNMIVQACVTGNHPDPIPSNNCVELVIGLD